MVMKILPKLKSRLEGEYIQYNDQVFFEAIENGSYLSFNYTYEQKPIQKKDRDYLLRIKPSVFGDDLKVFKSFFSSVPEMSWYIVKFSDKRTDEFSLYGHDMVTIKHSETGGLVCAQFPYHSPSQELYSRIYQGEEAEKTIPGESLFEIRHRKTSCKGDKFPFRNWDSEQMTKFSCALMFNHFITGKDICLYDSETHFAGKTLAVLYNKKMVNEG